MQWACGGTGWTGRLVVAACLVATAPRVEAGVSIGEGPWAVSCNGTLCGEVHAYDGVAANTADGWNEYFAKKSNFNFLSSTTSWTIAAIHPAPTTLSCATFTSCQKTFQDLVTGTGTVPITLLGTAPSGAGTVRAYHAPGHYAIVATTTGGTPVQAEYWVVANGNDRRSELICAPEAAPGLPWPKYGATTWTITWLDASAFAGCAEGEALYSYTVNLKP